MLCPACSSEINTEARFCSACGRPVVAPFNGYAAHIPVVRPRQGRAIAGVCAAFANRFGWDVVLVRLFVCLAVLFGCGTPVIAYLFAWVIIPNGPFVVPVYAAPQQPVGSVGL